MSCDQRQAVLNACTADIERTDPCAYSCPKAPWGLAQSNSTVGRPHMNLCAGCQCVVEGPTRIQHLCMDASRGCVQESCSCVACTRTTAGTACYRLVSLQTTWECNCTQKDSQITETESRQWWWKRRCKLQPSRTAADQTEMHVH